MIECPKCGCVDNHPCDMTRAQQIGCAIRRRRQCVACYKKFYTRELAEQPASTEESKDDEQHTVNN